MMVGLLILVVLALLAGIVLLSAKSPLRKLTRKEFLQELTKFLEGVIELIDDDEEGGESYRIRFKFKKEEFVYEDHEKQGFKGKIYRSYIKLVTPSKLTLTFTEKKRSTKVRSDIFIASEVSSKYIEEGDTLQIPEYFKDLKVFASNVPEANKILEDKKIVSFLRKYKNVDTRGYPFLSFGILDGVIILEFRSIKAGRPSISSLRENVSSVDDYLEQLILIARKLKEKL